MNKKRFFFALMLILLVVAVLEFLVLLYKKNRQKEHETVKQATVMLTALPDLALSTEARFIRHRSLTTLNSVFSEEGMLGDYFPSGFAYTLPPYLQAGARIVREP